MLPDVGRSLKLDELLSSNAQEPRTAIATAILSQSMRLCFMTLVVSLPRLHYARYTTFTYVTQLAMCRHGTVTPIMVSSAAPQALDEERLASGEDDTY